jgi:hypothetical protein
LWTMNNTYGTTSPVSCSVVIDNSSIFMGSNAADEPRANGFAVCESGDRRERTRSAS